MTYRSTLSTRRDEAIAAEVNIDRALMCPALGCPNRWSVEGERGRACSAHYWAASHDWPRITQELLDAETRRALRCAVAASQPPAAPVPIEQRRATVAAFNAFVEHKGGDPRAWARERLRRHDAREGRRLTPAEVDECRRLARLDVGQ